MLNSIISFSAQSYGLLPLMAFILLIALIVIADRVIFFAVSVKKGTHLDDDLELVNPGNLADLHKLSAHYTGSVQGALVSHAIRYQASGEVELERKIEEAIMRQMPKLDRNLWVLDTAVTLGPLLGLFGTIAGMIGSFNVLGASGTGNPMAVSGGIAHALIATGFGLTIAIIGMVMLNYLNKRVRMVILQMDLIKSMLISRLTHTAQVEKRLTAVAH
ncbi:MotA/TolQ/ExbB proton channel family protein [Glaciimonas immobilis]|uniref:Biopolymer transport protein ExbB n=1 Tax=Glaciimonas immobilis TaxID=728004 RepID=A0A840RV31_9BURK|nr:MotA/TolQ/ExbB proton channel family protein [Glaciimonas immobilis]KAF3996595.1 MotA/TolQ/ExbB proton channel family protein [Glaciimonas immobilis]MBB5201032.1 biopolymer transport protein ExbB [Glaciimonas immobilis]